MPVSRAVDDDAAGAPSGGEDADDAAAAFKSLAHPSRLLLLRFLVRPHHVEEMAAELGVARQTAQEHLQRLLEAGLVAPRKGRGDHGPVTTYVVVPSRVFALYERLGVLAGLQPDVTPDAPLHALTTPLVAARAPAVDAAVPRLVVVHGARIGSAVPLVGGGPWLVGRDPHATLCLDYDPFVSTRHAEVRRDEEGFVLADLYSRNGTYLDWRPLPRGGSAPLPEGGVVRAGRSLLLFRRP